MMNVIINTFAKNEIVKKYCKIDGVLTVVDCKHFLTQLNRERPKDAVNEPAQQEGFADKLLLNKIDACTREHIDETKAVIRGINAFVPIRECCLSQKPDEVPLGDLLAIEAFDTAKLLTEQAGTGEVQLVVVEDEVPQAHGGGHGEGHGHSDGHGSAHGDCSADCADESHAHGGGHGEGHGHGHGTASRHDTDVRSMVLEKAGSGLQMREFKHFLAKILEERSVDLYRYKGVLCSCDSKGVPLLYILQGVHDMPEVTFSGQWPEGKPMKTQVVLIGRKLDTEGYRKEFNECFV